MTKTAEQQTMRIMYVHSDAFTTCDCGKDLMLSQRVFGDNTYRGMCSCGKSWALLNGKIQSWEKKTRYEIHIMFKGEHGSICYPVKSLKEANEWLEECVDDTVHSVEVVDTIKKVPITYEGRQISKGAFL